MSTCPVCLPALGSPGAAARSGFKLHHRPARRCDVSHEIILRLRIVEGQVRTDEATFKGFEDEFERQGVPAMRDMTMQVFSVLDGRDLPASLAGVMASTPMDDREQAIGEHRRRRRRNAVDHERVAELYRRGGARQIAETETVSEATAYRWVKAARLAGVLEGRG